MSEENYKVRGFYYESELNNKYIAATLHPNTKAKLDPDDKDRITFDPSPKPDATNKDEVDSSGYYKDPLCTAIMPEDFNIDIINSFVPIGGDPIGQAWSATAPAVSAYVNKETEFGEKINGLLSDLGEIGNSAGVKFKDFIAKKFKLTDDKAIDKKVKGIFNDVKNIVAGKDNINLRSSMVLQGTSYKSYSGSTITVGNGGLAMRFTIFSEFRKVGEGETAKYVFIPCTWEVNRILPFVIGEWEPLNESAGKDNKTYNSIKKEWIGIDKDSFINWQRPPAGFEATYMSIDVINRGTLKLKLGNFYYLDNLVIQQGSFNFSKTMAKIPYIDTNTYSREVNSTTNSLYTSLHDKYLIKDAADLSYSYFCPYSCDVTLTLVPVSNYSRDKVVKFMQGYYSPDEIRIPTETKQLEYSDKPTESTIDVLNSGTLGNTKK